MPTQTTAIVTQLIPHRYKETGLYQSASVRTTPEHPSPSVLAKDMAALSLQNNSKRPQAQKDKRTKPVYQPPHRRRNESPMMKKEPIPKPQTMMLDSRIELAILISLLNTLVHEYPRQDSFHSLSRWFYCLDKGSFWGKNSSSFRYIKTLSEALIINNLSRFEQLSREQSVGELFVHIIPSDDQTEGSLAQIALRALINDLRSKVNDTAWGILRAAYREADSINSGDWLARALILSVPSTDKSPSQKAKYIDTWFLNKPKIQVTPKEGVEGRWMLHR